MKKLRTIETFVGAGGSFTGFKRAGFNCIYANDVDEDFLKTLLYNNPELKKTALVEAKPIEKLNFKKLLLDLKLKKKEIDVIFGGPVCKGYSLAGVRDPSDIRNTLYRHQINLIREFMPKIALIENVPAMKNSLIVETDIDEKTLKEISYVWKQLDIFKGVKAALRKKDLELSEKEQKRYENIKKKKKEFEEFIKSNSISVIDDIKKQLEKIGYVVKIQNLNASWYGAYTKRIRVIIAAVRSDLKKEFIFPTINYFNTNEKKINGLMYSDNLLAPLTIKDAFKLIEYNGKNSIQNDNDNKPMNHDKKSIERFSYIPKGKNIVEVMDNVPKHLHISRFYSRGCTMRLDDNQSSPTLVPGHSNFPVHPFEHRSITVREAATITGFPIDYKFFGTHTKRCEQVGNAVVVQMAEALAESCKKILL